MKWTWKGFRQGSLKPMHLCWSLQHTPYDWTGYYRQTCSKTEEGVKLRRLRTVISDLIRTDFKNISKGEIIRFASKLGELRPEVAKEVLVQFPEFVSLMKTALTEYKGMLDDIISSDDSSINEYYGIANKEMDSAVDSRKKFYEFVKQVQDECRKLLDNPNLPPEMIMKILKREAELVKIANEKDTEIREQEKEIEDKANKKDTEKREFNWKFVGGISSAVVAAAGISAGVLGGKFDFKLPKK